MLKSSRKNSPAPHIAVFSKLGFSAFQSRFRLSGKNVYHRYLQLLSLELYQRFLHFCYYRGYFSSQLTNRLLNLNIRTLRIRLRCWVWAVPACAIYQFSKFFPPSSAPGRRLRPSSFLLPEENYSKVPLFILIRSVSLLNCNKLARGSDGRITYLYPKCSVDSRCHRRMCHPCISPVFIPTAGI